VDCNGQTPTHLQQRLYDKHTGRLVQDGLTQAALMWPTARAEDSESAGNHPNATDSLTGATRTWATPEAHNAGSGRSEKNFNSTKHGARCLVNESAMWTTPNVPSRGPESQATKDARGSGGVVLQTQTTMWQTPNCPRPHDSNNTAGAMMPGQRQYDLTAQVHNWPTPDANCHKGSTQPGQRVGQLDEAAEVLWATPRAEMSAGSNGVEWTPGCKPTVDGRPITTSLTDQVSVWHGRESSPSSHPAQPTHAGETSSPSRRRLNPQFVTWLMGWPPLAESGFVFSETEWSHYRQRQRSELSGMRWKEIGDDDASLFS
jgi:hypothetical protein